MQVQQTETFNYAYPETQAWTFQSTADYQNSVANTVQQLYGSALAGGVGGDNSFVAESVPAPAVQVRRSFPRGWCRREIFCSLSDSIILHFNPAKR